MKFYKVLNRQRYVMATLSYPTKYLRYLGNGVWALTDNIALASKTEDWNLASELIQCHMHDTGDTTEIAPILIDITYSIVDPEDDDETD